MIIEVKIMEDMGKIIAELIADLRITQAMNTSTGMNSQKSTADLSLDEYGFMFADNYNKIKGHLNELDGVDCPICLNRGDIACYSPEMGQYVRICECMKKRRSVRLLRKSGLDSSIKKFSEYLTNEPWQAEIKRSAMEFVAQTTARCFYIGGQSGAGKTHICTAIAREFLKQCREVRYIVWVQAVEQLKSYDNADRFVQSNDYSGVDVLYIDDFFKPCGNRSYTPTEIRKTFELIDRRYKQPNKITIISSELELSKIDSIDQATAGRIYEMAGHGRFAKTVPNGAKYNFRAKGV